MNEKYEIDHRFIAIISDKTAEILHKAKMKPEKTLTQKVTKTLFSLCKEHVAITLGRQAISLIQEIRGIINKRADLTTLSYSESKKRNFIFPPGHPRENVVYAQHPANSLMYYTASSFHRQAFEHKFAEVITLLSSLGAREIKVEHVRGWNREFSAEMGVSMSPHNVKVSIGKNSSKSDSILFDAKLIGHDNPSIPDNLVWYPHEKLWQTVAIARVEKRLSDFNLALTYSDDYGINTNFKASLKNTGLDLGGNFVEHQSTLWKITGVFGPA